MFTNDKNKFDQEVDRVIATLSTMQVETKEYRDGVESLKVLCDARGVKSTKSLSTDTIISAVANILGIILVLNYEKSSIITSKAISFIFKGGRS